MTEVSVVTPTLGRPQEVRELLTNLAEQSVRPLELVLVDGAPDEDERTRVVVEALAPELPYRCRYLRHGGGTAIQRNVGIEASTGRFVAFVDDDVRLESDYLERMLEVFADDPEGTLGGVAGYITNQHLAADSSRRWRWYRRLRLFTTYEPGRYDFGTGYPINRYLAPPHEGLREIDFMGAGCAVWRREVFAAGLRFSEFFVGYAILEDAHFALRARRRWRLLENGRARARHLRSPRSRVDLRHFAYMTAVNYRYVFVDLVPRRTLGQELRFWRVQLVDLVAFFAALARHRDRDRVGLVLGKLAGIVHAFRMKAARPSEAPHRDGEPSAGSPSEPPPAAGVRRRRLRDHGRNLALTFVSLAVTLLLLELVCRQLVPSSPPGTTYGRPVEVNAQGLRDRDFDVPKPAGTERILVLGDSFTWGVGLDVHETIPKRLESLLAEAGRRVEVVNAAEPGHNTVEELLRLEEMGPLYAPDLVLLIYNLNDVEYSPELAPRNGGEQPPPEDAAVPVVEIDPDEEITRYSRNAGLRGLVLELERRSVLVRLLVPRLGMLLRRIGLLDSVELSWVEKIYQGFTEENPGWSESRRALDGIAEYCREAGCAFLVAVYPLLVELESYQGGAAHAAIAGFCRERGIEVADLLEVFEGTRSTSHWINVIDSHPDADAHEAVARRLLSSVLGALPAASDSDARLESVP